MPVVLSVHATPVLTKLRDPSLGPGKASCGILGISIRPSKDSTRFIYNNKELFSIEFGKTHKTLKQAFAFDSNKALA